MRFSGESKVKAAFSESPAAFWECPAAFHTVAATKREHRFLLSPENRMGSGLWRVVKGETGVTNLYV